MITSKKNHVFHDIPGRAITPVSMYEAQRKYYRLYELEANEADVSVLLYVLPCDQESSLEWE